MLGGVLLRGVRAKIEDCTIFKTSPWKCLTSMVIYGLENLYVVAGECRLAGWVCVWFRSVGGKLVTTENSGENVWIMRARDVGRMPATLLLLRLLQHRLQPNSTHSQRLLSLGLAGISKNWVKLVQSTFRVSLGTYPSWWRLSETNKCVLNSEMYHTE